MSLKILLGSFSLSKIPKIFSIYNVDHLLFSMLVSIFSKRDINRTMNIPYYSWICYNVLVLESVFGAREKYDNKLHHKPNLEYNTLLPIIKRSKKKMSK